MNDSQLRAHLLETCPVLPGQESRAWISLREKINPQATPAGFSLLKAVAACGVAVLLAAAIFDFGLTMRPTHHGLAFADSQVPGIYATSFYSHTARAQVVWLNGMDPVSDKLTYLDPTTVIKSPPKSDATDSDRL